MYKFGVNPSPHQCVPRLNGSSCRNHSRTKKHLTCGWLQAILVAFLSVVMLGSGFAAAQNSTPNNAPGGGRSKHHGPQLTVSARSLSFGNVTVNIATTLSLTLTSSGATPVTISSASITGAGFSIVAQSFPVTLDPTQSLTLVVQFDPATSGNVSGQLTINSNASNGSTVVVSLGGAAIAANPQLTISATSLTFGNVTVDTATAQSLTLTSSGTTPVIVSSASITGAGFSIVGGSFPVTLTPTQTLALQVQFDPTTVGNATGQLTISSNSSSGSPAVIALSGAGTSVAHHVNLSWNAPASSPDPAVGYNVYRSPGNGSFALLNTSPVTVVSYVDSTVVSASSYTYEVKSVDSSGVESVPSNQVTVTVP